MNEKAHRSLVKTSSWRFLATADTVVIAYFVTHDLTIASSIGAIEVFTKLFLYYAHERAWNRITFGKVMMVAPYKAKQRSIYHHNRRGKWESKTQ